MKGENYTLMSQRGFSLIELMVAIAIVAIVIVALSATFERSGRLYTTQNVSSALQEEVRAAVEIMARELRMAGYNPQKTSDFRMNKFDFRTTSIRVHQDLNENGALDTSGFPSCERLSFRYSSGTQTLQMICGEGTASQDAQVLIGVGPTANSDTRVTVLDFDYRDASDNSTTFPEDIRGVVITLVAQAPAGRDGMIERSYSSRVEFRNAAPNVL